jgi:hypothetical protein
MRARGIVVGQVIGQQSAKVPFRQHHDMIEALAPDRSDQPFNMTVLPRRDAKAAKRFFRRLLKGLQYVPRVIVTDKLRSYGVAQRSRMPELGSSGSVRGAASNGCPLYVACHSAGTNVWPSSKESGEPHSSLGSTNLCGRCGPAFPGSAVQGGRSLWGQHRFEPFFDQLLTNSGDSHEAGVQRYSDLAVAPSFPCITCIQQDAGPGQLPRRVLATLDQGIKALSLFRTELR